MFVVQKVAGIVKSQHDNFGAIASLSRDATEEIISIAFAPPGKKLNAQEQKQVVEKFLGASQVQATQDFDARRSSAVSSSGNGSFAAG